MNSHIKPAALVYNGHVIDDRGEKLSLTSMWKAAGSPANQDPAQWQRTASAEAFIEAVAVNMGKAHNELVQTTRGGKNPGTWAHWQIGIAYAKYLDPNFHMWVNTAAREKMEGKALAALNGLSETDRAIIGNIVKNCTNIVVQPLVQKIDDLTGELDLLKGEVDKANISLRRAGITALQAWNKYGLPDRVRGRCQWLTCRLLKLGAGIEFNGRADVGNKAVHLFDPDKVEYFMKETGLLLAARRWAEEKLGQGVLRLIPEKIALSAA